MSDLRTAALRALEAMDDLHRTGDTQVFDLCHRETTENLRAALAEPWPVGVVTSMVKGGVTWHIWPDQMPDGTTLYAAAPIIKPEIKEDNSVPQAQQFLYSAWAR